MKIGDYIRNDIGEIGKLEDLKLEYTKGKRLVTYYTYREVKENLVVFDNKNITQRFVDGSSIYLTDDELKNVEDSIVKSSPNIKDLIKAGDFITYKYINTYWNIPTSVYAKYKDDETILMVDDYTLNEIEILSIVTKEQYESVKYKINE